MPDMLDLVAALPELELAPGDVLCSAGDQSGSIWVLVSGSLRVMKSDTEVNRVEQPGMSIGETSVLLGIPNTATVIAAAPTRLKVAEDGAALLRTDPELVLHVAAGLADRLNMVSTYLADLKQQYGEAPGLAMVGEVLSGLASHPRPRAVPGSRRDPDPEY